MSMQNTTFPVSTRGRLERASVRSNGGVEGGPLIMSLNFEVTTTKYVGVEGKRNSMATKRAVFQLCRPLAATPFDVEKSF